MIHLRIWTERAANTAIALLLGGFVVAVAVNFVAPSL
jgi:hypothetical protein